MNKINNQKITSKTIKILFVTGIIGIMIISFGMIDMAEAKVHEDKIHDNKLLKRHDGWKSQYMDDAEFKKDGESFKSYVDAQHPDSEWNKVTKKNQIRIHNFDTLTGERFSGLNALLVDVQTQKNNNTYNPTEAEKRFHDWVARQIPNPVMPADVKPKFVERVIQTYNESANHGHVPNELYFSDVEFWANIVTDKICEYTKECDLNGINVDAQSQTFGLIPYAYALSIGHLLTINIDSDNCVYSSVCFYENSSWLIGTGTISVNSGDAHAGPIVKRVSYSINDKSYYYGIDENHTVSGVLQLLSSTYNISSKSGLNEVTKSGSYYFGSVTCGSTDCGTYNLTATAQNVTI